MKQNNTFIIWKKWPKVLYETIVNSKLYWKQHKQVCYSSKGEFVWDNCAPNCCIYTLCLDWKIGTRSKCKHKFGTKQVSVWNCRLCRCESIQAHFVVKPNSLDAETITSLDPVDTRERERAFSKWPPTSEHVNINAKVVRQFNWQICNVRIK